MTNKDRRHFNRVKFHARAELKQDEQVNEAEVVDISLKGILLEFPSSRNFSVKKPISAKIFLGEDTVIEMNLCLAHSNKNRYGFYCENIDVDSITHLRRLITLNTGDSEASERELVELLAN